VRGKHASVPGAGFDAGASGPLKGVTILDQQFPGGGLRLVVEAAFGANLTGDPNTWAWTDITTDVEIGNNRKIMITVGKQDARSTSSPAQMTLTLNNRQNAYSKSPFSSNWPNVRRGLPVRVRAVFGGDDVAGSKKLFQGRAVSLQPGFDVTGRWAVVTLTAAGTLRRLGQGNQPLLSTLRQYTPGVSNLVAYWPLEDPTGAIAFAPAGPLGAAPMTSIGAVSAHSNTTIVASDALPTLGGSTGSTLVGFIPSYVSTGAVQIRMVVNWPTASGALPDGTVVLRLFTLGGTAARFDVLYGTGGSLKLNVYDPVGTLIFNGVAATFNVDGTSGALGLALSTSGSDIATMVTYYKIGAGSAGYSSNTVTARTIGTPQYFSILPTGIANSTFSLGHITVQSQSSDIFELGGPLNAYDGEYSYDRVTRLLALVGAPTPTVFGDGMSFPQRMGPQRIDTLINLIRECEATDAAIVTDGHNDSLTFDSHLLLENLTPALTVDARTQLMPPFAPVDDDQQLRNSWTVAQRGGPSVSFSLTDPSNLQSTVNAGVYPDSATINVFGNADAAVGTQTGGFGVKAQQNLASWLAHQFTPDGYRVPSFQLAFHHNPELMSPFVTNTNVDCVMRMDVTHLADVYPQMPPWTQQYMVLGYTYMIDKFLWDTTVNVVPYDPWHVALVAKPSGDTGENVARCDTVSSQVGLPVAPGANSIQVYSADKSAWTTTADDFPLTIAVQGIPVTVTAITGGTSPQTFTVDPTTVTKALPAGADVRLWNPPVIAIGGVT
jgi:hypothetical protein